MDSIHDLFLDLRTNKQEYLKAASGRDFENLFVSKLDEVGYESYNSNDLTSSASQRIKSSIEDDDGEITNPTSLDFHYIEQPFGSQQYPDILLFNELYVSCIELKFSKKGSVKPLWNSGLPRAYGLYIFASRGKNRNDVTFFRGCDIVTNKERELLKGFFDDEIDRSVDFNKEHMANQKFGFCVYARKAYHQSRTFNSNAVTNFFNNSLRLDLETSLLNHIETMIEK